MRASLILAVVLASCSQPPGPTEAEPARPRTAETPTGEVLCPVLADTRAIGGTPESLVGELFPSNLDGMLAALPERAGDWSRSRAQSIPRGTAGTASPQASAHYARGDGEDALVVRLTDLVHVCRCQEGDGERLRDRAVTSEQAREARAFAEVPALVSSNADAPAVRAWVEDRCLVELSGAQTDDLVVMAEAIDWGRLREACPRP